MQEAEQPKQSRKGTSLTVVRDLHPPSAGSIGLNPWLGGPKIPCQVVNKVVFFLIFLKLETTIKLEDSHFQISKLTTVHNTVYSTQWY